MIEQVNGRYINRYAELDKPFTVKELLLTLNEGQMDINAGRSGFQFFRC